MIDTDKYKIEDDVVWIWNDYPDDEGWVLEEYKECPAEKGGYTLMDGRGSDTSYEPWHQVLPALKFECSGWRNRGIDERMHAIMDLPLLLAEVKRLREVLAEIKGTIDEYIHDVWDGNLEGWQCASDNIAALGIKSEWEEEE